MKTVSKPKTKLLKPTIVTFAVFLLSVMPLLLIARYDHPSADDFTYGLQSARALAGGGSIFSMLSAACRTVHDTYFSWQGSFSGVFLMAVQPAAYGEKFYFLTPLLVLGLFLFGTFFLLKTLLRGRLKSDRCTFLIIGSVMAAMSLNTLPSPVEGIYWYNGAMYYTGFYSVSLIVFALVIRFFHAESRKAKIRDAVIALILSFFLGGSNFTTALETALVLAVLAFFAPRNKRKENILLAAGAAAMDLAGLAVSAAAPGNLIRKQYFKHTPDALHAVYLSFRTALVFLYKNTTPMILLCLLFLAPLIYRMVRKAKCAFPSPLLTLALTFCLFSAQFAPPMYALGTPGPDRLLNIVSFSYYWFLLINLTCALEWVARKLRRQKTRGAEEAVFAAGSQLAKEHMTAVLACFAVLFAASCFGSGQTYKMTSVSAFNSLRTGQAAQYSREVDSRLEIYRNSRGKDIAVRKFSQRPYVLCFNDVEPDASYWRNQAVAEYYGLKSVRRIP